MWCTGRVLSGWVIGVTLALAFVFATSAIGQEDAPSKEAVSGILDDVVDPAITETELVTLLVPLTVDELAETALKWQEIIRVSLAKTAKLNLSITTAADEELETLRNSLTESTERITELNPKYTLVLDAWERKGAVPEELLKHRTYQAAVATDTVRTTDPVTLLRGFGDWLVARDGGLGVLLRLGGFVLAIWVMFAVSGFARRAARRGLEKVPHLSKLLVAFILGMVYWLTFTVGIMIVLALFGVNITPLFAVFGGASFILGFALQEVLGNLASGLMLMILKPFDMGDFIEAAGTAGVVDDMSVVSTKIRTFDNQIIMVPNSKIWGDVITNVNASERRRVDLVFGIAYSDNAARAIDLLMQLVKADSRCLLDPEPAIFVGELGESSVNIFCRPWVRTEDYWDVYWGITGQAKELFDQEGISIPFPQRDVHLVSSDPLSNS